MKNKKWYEDMNKQLDYYIELFFDYPSVENYRMIHAQTRDINFGLIEVLVEENKEPSLTNPSATN